MDDIKYVLLPRIDNQPKDIKHQPWYKERLKNKYMSKSKNKEKILDTTQWTFIKDGLDDFRDGKVPPHNDVLIKPEKGPSPSVKNKTRLYKQSALRPENRYSVTQRCYSHSLPLVEAKKQRVEQIIYGLSQHPLALYPHLEESVPADLFDDIVDLLDPDMNQISNSVIDNNDPDFNRADKSHSAFTSQSSKTRETTATKPTTFDEARKLSSNSERAHTSATNQTVPGTERINSREFHVIRNTYKWLLKKEEAKANAKGPDADELKAQAIDNHIKTVTEDFCGWIKSIGSEHNIDPVTLTSLFASGYETKPALSVPIHVVELTNIPPELRNSAAAGVDKSSDIDFLSESTKNVKKQKMNIDPKKSRNRYGAWYLPKNLWHLMPRVEKLVDPKLSIDKEKEESKKRIEDMNSKLAPLHGTNAFRSFVKNRNLERVPKMIEEVNDWEHEQIIKETAIIEQNKKDEEEPNQNNSRN